jgi:hypothetical protein
MLQGMPRRISDYPYAFAGWNLISSFGSIISVLATWLFLYIVYIQLVEGKATSRYPWLTPQFYSDSLQTLLNRSYNSLEWALTSPPKPHAFVSLPLQSLLGLILYNYLSNWKVITIKAFCILVLGYVIRGILSYSPITYYTIMALFSATISDLSLDNIPGFSSIHIYQGKKPLFNFIDLLPMHKINDIDIEHTKPKLYNAMNNGEGSSSGQRSVPPSISSSPNRNLIGSTNNGLTGNYSLDKGDLQEFIKNCNELKRLQLLEAANRGKLSQIDKHMLHLTKGWVDAYQNASILKGVYPPLPPTRDEVLDFYIAAEALLKKQPELTPGAAFEQAVKTKQKVLDIQALLDKEPGLSRQEASRRVDLANQAILDQRAAIDRQAALDREALRNLWK